MEKAFRICGSIVRDHLASGAEASLDPFHVHKGRVYIVGEEEDGNLVVRRYAVSWPTGSD